MVICIPTRERGNEKLQGGDRRCAAALLHPDACKFLLVPTLLHGNPIHLYAFPRRNIETRDAGVPQKYGTRKAYRSGFG